MPLTRPWRGYINQILHGTSLREPLSDEMVDRLADELIRQKYFTRPVADYYAACGAALASGDDLAFDENQNEDAVRDLLVRLRRALDRRRPWAEPWFYVQAIEDWDRLSHAPVVGAIPLMLPAVSARLHRTFHSVQKDPEVLALVLKLRTGQLLALRSSSPFSTPGVDLMTLDDPAQTVLDFTELSGMEVAPPAADESATT